MRGLRNHIVLILVLAALLIIGPVLVQYTDIVKVSELKGYYLRPNPPDLDAKSWFDRSYQDAMDDYLVSHLDIRPTAVRLANEFEYKVFNKANARYVVVGDSDYLYEEAYIEAHLGLDKLADSIILSRTNAISQIRDEMEENGVKLLTIFAPGKASYFPEYVPGAYYSHQKRVGASKTNFQGFKETFSSEGLSYIDMKSWFEQMKDTTSHPLFPQGGIHWSTYGMHLAADSIMKYLENEFSLDLPDWEIDSMVYSATPLETDADIEQGMNLMYPLDRFPLAYPKHQINDSGKVKISSIVIADSYYWGLFNLGLSNKAMKDGQFWYYFKQIYPDTFKEETLVEDKDVMEEFKKVDVVILLATDGTLDRFPFGLEVIQP